MKTSLLVLILGAALATGCASHYNVRLANGTVITSKGKPKLDKTSGAYVFTDAMGRPVSIPAGRVREISPASSSESSFRGAPSK
jgi:ABC-type Fe3+-hydroxamate transport system substrate-binding protein